MTAHRSRRFGGALVAGAALLLGAVAAYAARAYLAEQLALERERLQPKQQMVDVVVAKADLQRGDPIGPETMAIRPVPREYLPGGALTPDQFDHWNGRRLGRPMRGGEPLLQSSIEGHEAGSLSSRVRAGIRAVTIPVDESSSIAGLLRPGDRIDLMFTSKPPQGSAGQELTLALLQDVLVMATGRAQRAVDETGNARQFGSITVEVDPQQAQRLLVAMRAGRLTVALRHPDDRKPVSAAPMDLARLLGIAAPAAPPAKPTPELIVGGRGQLTQGREPSAAGFAPTATGWPARNPGAQPMAGIGAVHGMGPDAGAGSRGAQVESVLPAEVAASLAAASSGTDRSGASESRKPAP